MNVSSLLDYKFSILDFNDYILYSFKLDSVYTLRLYRNVSESEMLHYGLYNSMLDSEDYNYTLLKKRFLEKNL